MIIVEVFAKIYCITFLQVSLQPCKDIGKENALEDAGLHLLYITKYSLIERGASVRNVIGVDSLKCLSSYRDAIVHIYPILAGQVSLCSISFPFALCIDYIDIKHPFMWHSQLYCLRKFIMTDFLLLAALYFFAFYLITYY